MDLTDEILLIFYLKIFRTLQKFGLKIFRKNFINFTILCNLAKSKK